MERIKYKVKHAKQQVVYPYGLFLTNGKIMLNGKNEIKSKTC
jgi:hypothetical protein